MLAGHGFSGVLFLLLILDKKPNSLNVIKNKRKTSQSNQQTYE